MDTIRMGWAELLTGRATPADLLNALWGMAEVAADARQPVITAERAAVRYGASVRHKAFRAALPKGSEESALQAWSEVLRQEHPYLANKMLEEEGAKGPAGTRASRQAASAAKGDPSGKQDSEPYCLLWGLGLCNRNTCRFMHSCPYRGAACSSSGGCLLRPGGSGHLATLQRREVRDKVNSQPAKGSGKDRRSWRSRSRRRSRSASRRDKGVVKPERGPG